MGMKMTTPQGDIDSWFAKKAAAAERAIIDRLCYIGSLCINEAREHGDYNNPTGNLRSSIGFCVLKRGRVVKQMFADSLNDGRPVSREGISESKDSLSRLAREYASEEYCVIIAAGMSYAVYVEARGKNVLTSAELLAGRVVGQMLVELGFKVGK